MAKKISAKLRTRQRKAIKAKLNGMSSSQAAREAGYSETTARHADREVFDRPSVQSAFAALMEKQGITDELLTRRIHEGIGAKETKFFQKDGIVTDRREVIHHGERRAHVELALKLKGHLKDKMEISGALTLADLIEKSGEKSE